MPAYSFKERFVPFVKDGSKPGTIRNFRKHPVCVGQLAHLYYGMRTKYCTKLIKKAPAIHTVRCVYISDTGGVALIDTNWITPELRDKIRLYGKKEIEKYFDKVRWLNRYERDIFAWEDGFRDAKLPEITQGCFFLMSEYWKLNGGLPYIGFHTLWGKSRI